MVSKQGNYVSQANVVYLCVIKSSINSKTYFVGYYIVNSNTLVATGF